MKIWNGLKVSVMIFLLQQDRKSRGTGTSKTDYGFVTGLNYKF